MVKILFTSPESLLFLVMSLALYLIVDHLLEKQRDKRYQKQKEQILKALKRLQTQRDQWRMQGMSYKEAQTRYDVEFERIYQ